MLLYKKNVYNVEDMYSSSAGVKVDTNFLETLQ